MGNTPTVLDVGDDEKVDVMRYTMTATIRYRGNATYYIYESKEYGVSITPYDVTNSIKEYDPKLFDGCANEKKLVKVKKSLLLACVEFLKAKNLLENEIQKELAVN